VLRVRSRPYEPAPVNTGEGSHGVRQPSRVLIAALVAVLALSGCSLAAQPNDLGQNEVVLVTHDSWKLPPDLIEEWEDTSGYDLIVRKSGDTGTLTNKLVLTKGSPTGDVVFGIDNTFASRALSAEVFANNSIQLPTGAATYELPQGTNKLVPIDNANVCVNVDLNWFAKRGLPPPTSLDDLTKSQYRGLLVVPGATTSSPGLAFMLATIDEYGADWLNYWQSLLNNGVKITSGWSDAYFVDFTATSADGTRPIVISYDSSPAFTPSEDGKRTTTAAVPNTCIRQVEYAGVLADANNPEGAASFIEFLLSAKTQAALPTNMFVFPVRQGVRLPTDWAKFARQPENPRVADPDQIDDKRESWLRSWAHLTST
jgi:thiamine transport system substrate-binding protein